MKESRPYQNEFIDTVMLKHSQGVKRQLAVMATGLGKTYCGTQIIKKFERTLWITHNIELIEQSALAILHELTNGKFTDRINELGGIMSALDHMDRNIGMFSTGNKYGLGIIKQDRFDINEKIVVASVQTLTRRLDKIDPNAFDLVIVDEAHLFMSETFNRAVEHFTPSLRLGLTATPERMDGISLLNLFDEIVFEKDILFGVKNKYLCELEAVRVKTSINIDDVRTLGGELNAKDLKKLDTPERNALIVQKYKEHTSNRQALVFCVDVDHAINMSAEFNNQGISSEFIVDDEKLCPDRKQRIQRFKSGATTVVTNVQIMTTGFDHPEVSSIIMARPTKSKTLFMQCVGRGTRLKQGSFKDCIILDIVDATSRHKLVNCYELDKENDTDNRIFWNSEHKARIKAQLAEKKLRETVLEKEIAKDTRINLFKIPKVKISRYSTYDEPATLGQLKWISDKGYNVEENTYTKGQCTEIISRFPASAANILFLKVNGYDVSGSEITIGEFQAAKNEIEKRLPKKDVQSKGFVIKNVRG